MSANENAGPLRGWIVRSHFGWEENETPSPFSASGGLGRYTMFPSFKNTFEILANF